MSRDASIGCGILFNAELGCGDRLEGHTEERHERICQSPDTNSNRSLPHIRVPRFWYTVVTDIENLIKANGTT